MPPTNAQSKALVIVKERHSSTLCRALSLSEIVLFKDLIGLRLLRLYSQELAYAGMLIITRSPKIGTYYLFFDNISKACLEN